MSNMFRRMLAMLLVVCMVVPYMMTGASAAEQTDAAVAEPTAPVATVAPMPQEESEPMETETEEIPYYASLDIVGISLEPYAMYEQSGGEWRTETLETGEEGKYYHYAWYYQNFPWIAHFTDGTTFSVRELPGVSFEHNGCWYRMEWNDTQSYANQWTAGGSYTVSLCLINENTGDRYEAQTTVEILASPLSILRSTKITLHEGVEVEDVEYEKDGVTTVWQRYNWEEYIAYTLTFTDGTVVEGIGSSFEYNGQRYFFDITDNQSPETPWKEGSNNQVSISIMGKTRTFRVGIEKNPVNDMDIQQIRIAKDTEGHWADGEIDGEYAQYWRYDWHNLLRYQISLWDNDSLISVESEGGSFHYQGQDYDFTLYDDQSAENPWEPGVHTASIGIFGKRFEVEVVIEESPVVSVSVEPLQMYPYSDGYWRTEGTETFFVYHWQNSLQWTVEFNDGHIETGMGNGLSYNGDYYEFYASEEMQWENPWQVGVIPDFFATFAGIEVPIAVTIVESPVESLTVEPVVLYENQNCSQEKAWSELQQEYVEYTHYHWDCRLRFRVDFKDGTWYEGENTSGFEYQGRGYNLHYKAQQGPDDQWVVGGQYTGTVSAFGVEVPVSISLNASPVESIYLNPVNVYKGVHSSVDTYCETDEYGNTYSKEYDRYNWWDQLSYTVYFNDGSDPAVGRGSGFYYNGQYFSFSYEDSQGQYEQWQPGDNRMVRVSAMGVSAETTVTVRGSAIERIDISPISIVEYTGGSWWNQGTAEEFYYYEWQNFMQYTVYFCDGTSYSGSGGDLVFQGCGYRLQWDYPQNSSNPWTAGNTYSVGVRGLGYETQAQVTITESPVESITFASVSIIENTGGEMRYPVDPDTGMPGAEYYHYYWWNSLSYTITFSDGTAPITGTGSCVYYNGQEYNLDYQDMQGNGLIMTAGNIYTMELSFMGVSGSAEISIVESPLLSISVSPVTLVENAGGYTTQRWDETTQSQVDYYYYSWTNKCYVTLTFNDGQVITIRPYESFEYNGQTHYLEDYHEIDIQHITPWQAGGSYTIQVSFMEQSAQTQVLIEKLPVQSIVFDTVSIREYTYGNWHTEWIDGIQHNYFRYNWRDCLSYTITYDDGHSESGNGSGFYYNGQWISFQIADPQNPYNAFYAGNTYAIPVTVGSITENVYVNIYTSYQENGWEYMVQDDKAFITQCYNHVSLLEVPSVLGGYPVAGIISLDNAQGMAMEVVVPDSVTMLATDLFSGWGWRETLRRVTIGAGITDLSMDMFRNCTMLEAVDVSPANTRYCSEDGVVFDIGKSTVVVFPFGKTGNYTIPNSVVNADVIMQNLSDLKVTVDFNELEGYTKLDDVIFSEDMTVIYSCDADKTGSYVIPSTVTTIGGGAFANSQLTEVTIPEGVTEIAYYAFHGSAQLQRVNIPQSVTTIGFRAFEDCTSLTVADLPSNLQHLESGAFKNTAVKTVVLPASLKEVSWEAFYGAGVTNLTISEGVERIDDNAFAWTRIQSLELPSSLTRVGYNAFTGIHIQSLVLPDTLTDLGGNAFSNCRNLKEVTIGKGLPVISYGTFYNSGLTSVVIPENIEYIGGWSFAYCDRLKNVTFMNEAVQFGEGAFAYSGLETLDLGDQLTSIEWKVFMGTQLKEITIPDSVTAITYKSFADCEQLMDIDIPDGLQELWGNAFENTAWYNSQPDGPVFLEHFYYGYKGEVPKGTILNIPANITHLSFGQGFGSEFSAVIFQGNAPADAEFYDVNIIYPAGNTTWQDYIANGYYENTTFTEALYSGSCGDSLGWVLGADGTLQIFGFGRMYDFTYSPRAVRSATSAAPWNEYSDSITSIVIGADVEYIGSFAFADCAAQTVSFTGEAPEIGAAAFYNVTATATYPTGYDSWNNSASDNYGGNITWDALDTEVASGICGDNLSWVLDESGTLTVSGEGQMYNYWEGAPWFEYRDQIKRVYISDGITTVGGNAFSECANLFYVRLPDSLQRIEHGGAFQNCEKLQSIELPENLDTIGSSAFQSSGLKEIVIPDSVTSMGGHVFANCSNLTHATIGSGLSMLESYAFAWCENLQNVTATEGLRELTRYAFMGCTRLTEVNLPQSVTSISYNVFNNSGIQEITIPESVTDIGYAAFKWAYDLRQITFTGSAPNIDWTAFVGVNADVYFPGDDFSWQGVVGAGFGGNLRWYPMYNYVAEGDCGENLRWSLTEGGMLDINGDGPMYDYQAGTAPWYDYADRIVTVNLNGVPVVGEYAFYGCWNLEQVNSWGNVVAYGAYSFYGCEKLRFITESGSLAVIGEYAFAGCSDLEIFSFQANVREIGQYAFEGCSKLRTVFLEDNVNYVGQYAFSGCTALESVRLPENMTEVSDGLFSGCINLRNISLREGITSIGDEAFMNCKRLAEIHLPNTLEHIGDFAFFGCNSLTYLVIPSEVTYVGSYAMHNCTDMESVTFTGDMPEFGYQPLSNVAGVVTYPANAEGWSEDVVAGLGGNIQTEPYEKYYATIISDGEYLRSYTTLQDALKDCDPANQYIILQDDQNVDVTLERDVYLDLNGKKLTGTVTTNGHTIYGMDSVTDEYTSEGMGIFNCADENGNVVLPEKLVYVSTPVREQPMRYMAIRDEQGWSFHRFYLGITHTSLQIANLGLGYKATFCGDDMVAQQMDSYGYKLQIQNGKSVERWKSVTDFVSGKTLTLRVSNWDVRRHGDTTLYAQVLLKLKDGTVIESYRCDTSLRRVVEEVSKKIDVFSYQVKQALQNMVDSYPTMQSWAVEEIVNALPKAVSPENFDADYQYVLYKVANYDGPEMLYKTTITPSEGIWVECYAKTPQYDGQPAIEYNGQAWYGAAGAGDDLSYTLTDKYVVFSINEGEGYIYCELLADGTLRVVQQELYLSVGDILTPVEQ